MLDNAIYMRLRDYLGVAAPLRGITTGEYMLRFNQVQQGRPTERTVWMHKVADKRIGQRISTSRYDTASSKLVRTEIQSKETTIQFTVTQPVAMLDTDLTHSDVLNIIAATLQSDMAIRELYGMGLSLLRIGNLRNMNIDNDRDQNEENPSFDAVVKHNDVFEDNVPAIDRYNFKVLAVPNLAA